MIQAAKKHINKYVYIINMEKGNEYKLNVAFIMVSVIQNCNLK